MKVLYSDQPPYEYDYEYNETESTRPKSCFLVGPSPRSAEVPSWRPQALEILAATNYNGTVLVPEPSNGGRFPAYDNQITWEYQGLNKCDVIVAWVPRCMKTMLALTTNVEFGYWLAKAPEKLYYGRPDGAPHTAYLDWMYHFATKKAPINNLKDLLWEATGF